MMSIAGLHRVREIEIALFIRSSLLRRGIEHALSFMEEINVYSLSDVNEILSSNSGPGPDVAIVDIDLPAEGGLSLMRRLKRYFPEIGIIALTAECSDNRLFQVLKAQASACLSKEVSGEVLIDIVKKVARGEHPVNDCLVTHPGLADQVFREFQEMFRKADSPRTASQLTPREIEILDYVARGMMNKQIAVKLGISEQTIKNHVTSILRKLKANARAEAVEMAVRQGWIPVNNLT